MCLEGNRWPQPQAHMCFSPQGPLPPPSHVYIPPCRPVGGWGMATISLCAKHCTMWSLPRENAAKCCIRLHRAAPDAHQTVPGKPSYWPPPDFSKEIKESACLALSLPGGHSIAGGGALERWGLIHICVRIQDTWEKGGQGGWSTPPIEFTNFLKQIKGKQTGDLDKHCWVAFWSNAAECSIAVQNGVHVVGTQHCFSVLKKKAGTSHCQSPKPLVQQTIKSLEQKVAT